MSRHRKAASKLALAATSAEAAGSHAPPPMPAIVEIDQAALLPELRRPRTQAYQCGNLLIFRDFSLTLGYRLSVSHPTRQPTWDEIVHIRYGLIPDSAVMAMLLPSRSEYMQAGEHTFILWQVVGERVQE